MKQSFFLILIFLSGLLFAGDKVEFLSERATDSAGRSYEFCRNDPFGVRVYKLKNGMTVYLSRNTREPRVSVMLSVLAGSADDPLDSTGLAHYFEHMMFKGNSKINSLDWAKEAPLLQRIEDLFEQYRAEKDSEKRKAIYKEIDAVSLDAAQYGNDEFWAVMQSIGASGTNAWTSSDCTSYINSIPSHQLAKYLKLETVRFHSIALRRFHTELETVYEEFNRKQDSDFSLAFDELNRLQYPRHPYGRSVIGTPEHLKSPSMKDIRAFFDTYYVPANMAVILCGDLEFEPTMKLLEDTLGTLPAKTPPDLAKSPRMIPDDPQTTVRSADLVGPQPEMILLSFRFPVSEHNEIMLELISSLLSNGKCGLIERNLLLPQKVLGLRCLLYGKRNSLELIFTGSPLSGQSLEQIRDLVLQEINNLKKGDFPAWLPQAICNNERLSLITAAESPSNAVYTMLDAFLSGKSLAERLNRISEMEKISKQQIEAFAKENFKDNYSVVFKRTGPADSRVKAEKPPITPVVIPQESSLFAKEFAAIPPAPEPEPEFVDFKTALPATKIVDGLDFYATKNEENERFTVRYFYPAGSLSEPKLELLASYFPRLGTSRFQPSELKDELYRLAASISVSVTRTGTTLTLTGLNRNFDETLALFEHVLSEIKPDPKGYELLCDGIRKVRENRRKQPDTIFNMAISRALYQSKDNYAACEMSLPDILATPPEELTALLKSLRSYRHDVVYHGPLEPETAKQKIFARHIHPQKLHDFPKPRFFTIKPPTENTVYLIDVPSMSQVRVAILRPDAIFKNPPHSFEALLNAYGPRLYMNELRERRALAYSAYGSYSNPAILPGNYSIAEAFIATQPDKLDSALPALLDLMNDASVRSREFDAAKGKLLSVLRNTRIHRENYYPSFAALRLFGIDFDPQKRIYQELPSFTEAKFAAALRKHMTDKPYCLVIAGDLKKIDRDALKKFGPVVELSLDRIFPDTPDPESGEKTEILP